MAPHLIFSYVVLLFSGCVFMISMFSHVFLCFRMVRQISATYSPNTLKQMIFLAIPFSMS